MPTPQPTKIPPLVRFLLRHGAIGAAAGMTVATGMIVSDTASLGTLFATTSSPYVAGALFIGMFGFTFASLAMGTAVMMLNKDDFEDL